ncbi:MAG: ParB/RepB/Spo0J family partition protein [Patescibacteria group bacterium]|jgi:ParB family chromosome partitioning protein|nr:ParB/RepB/Spo0J family partition protein [Patescibacteria group bacterium]MDD3777948.1 ParB/RepB/Spo0J family partition protein [Patescibacteria group bacterium]MDD3939101.1 ParB/RepB/Spo0J family partition protein [Patescibacteria group bacterium]MDD4443596.1 ParB/RepB/Spo0J family partition protein [Patescibacteria group bacterium]
MAQGLGKGLGSLIPKKTVSYGQNPFSSEKESGVETKNEIISDNDRILRISPNKIDFNPFQPRSYFSDAALNDLAQSIKEHGILQPLVVTRKDDNRFELIAGERRLRSSKIIGLQEVPVIVREESNQKKLEFALIENLQRENLNPLETAIAYQRLINDFNLTQDQVAKKVGKARSSVANALRLLSLPQEAQNALAIGNISEAHAKQLLSLNDENKQLNMLKKILRYSLTVADTDKEIKRLRGKRASNYQSEDDRELETTLSQILSTKVALKRRGQGGQLTIDFYSAEELSILINKLKKNTAK